MWGSCVLSKINHCNSILNISNTVICIRMQWNFCKFTVIKNTKKATSCLELEASTVQADLSTNKNTSTLTKNVYWKRMNEEVIGIWAAYKAFKGGQFWGLRCRSLAIFLTGLWNKSIFGITPQCKILKYSSVHFLRQHKNSHITVACLEEILQFWQR